MKIANQIFNSIKAGRFNFLNVMRKSTYYGKKCNVDPLFASYGQIGWKINTDEGEILFDYELNKISYVVF